MRGDLQEGNGCASRCLFPLFPVPISFLPSTKSAFLCAFGVWSPHFRASRAQNQGFCAFWGFGIPIFRLFEYKIGVFVLFWPSRPLFSGVSSTKSRFLCFFALWNPHFLVFRAQNRGFCAQEEGKVGSESVTAETLTTLPPHLCSRTSAPAHRHKQRPPAMAPGAVKCCPGAV